jgi:hypothetical protein
VLDVRSYLLISTDYLGCWSTAISQTKLPVTQKKLCWSKLLESVLKDVECIFEIMKADGVF